MPTWGTGRCGHHIIVASGTYTMPPDQVSPLGAWTNATMMELLGAPLVSLTAGSLPSPQPAIQGCTVIPSVGRERGRVFLAR